jgi:hypothetical protein
MQRVGVKRANVVEARGQGWEVSFVSFVVDNVIRDAV